MPTSFDESYIERMLEVWFDNKLELVFEYGSAEFFRGTIMGLAREWVIVDSPDHERTLFLRKSSIHAILRYNEPDVDR